MNDVIMNEIEKSYPTFEGWKFYREYNFDQFKCDKFSMCVALGHEGPDNELNIQIYNDESEYVDSFTYILDVVNVEKVLEKVKEVMEKLKG